MFQSDKEERNSDPAMCTILVSFFIQPRIPLSVDALRQNLALLIDLLKHKSTDRDINIAARRALENHVWYLSDEAVCLVQFPDQVSVIDRVKIFARITVKRLYSDYF